MEVDGIVSRGGAELLDEWTREYRYYGSEVPRPMFEVFSDMNCPCEDGGERACPWFSDGPRGRPARLPMPIGWDPTITF